ncbi:hypothetical protein BOX15_Mlig008421g1 [Macrostomum lignano]|uniref:Uncharacterized protein n=1 Tax=Macrostomum lignano TaxID=282301 RepID=A0A267E7B4_9PLAT|nr:hypothetical protein BOX15_Mlig008421g1 [Macrostomum lignano]
MATEQTRGGPPVLLSQQPGEFQLHEDYDNNFYTFVGLLHRLRSKYEYVKRGYERKKLPPGRSLKHLVSIIESFIDLASSSLAAPAQYPGRVQPGDVPVPEAARAGDHVMRRRMVVIEDSGRLFALDPAVVVGGEVCMCGGAGKRQLRQKQEQQRSQQQAAVCNHCLFEKSNLLRIARELSRVANRGLKEQQQQQQHLQHNDDDMNFNQGEE